MPEFYSGSLIIINMQNSPISSHVSTCRQQGFSLVELIVVVVLLAILTVIAIPMYNDNLIDAYGPEGEAVLASFATTALRYRAHNGNSFAGMTKTILTNSPYSVDDGATDTWAFAMGLVNANDYTMTATATVKSTTYTMVLAYDMLGTKRQSITYSW